MICYQIKHSETRAIDRDTFIGKIQLYHNRFINLTFDLNIAVITQHVLSSPAKGKNRWGQLVKLTIYSSNKYHDMGKQ